MRAIRFHGRGDIRLDEVQEPICGAGQVKVCVWKTGCFVVADNSQCLD